MNVPIPPKPAERFNTACQFCIVGCGYRVFKWPVGRDGGPAPEDNALGVDFRAPLDAMEDWIAPAMHSVVTERDGGRRKVNWKDAVDLAGAELGGADLVGADLGGAKLIANNFNQANLTGIKLDGAVVERVLAKAARQGRAPNSMPKSMKGLNRDRADP